MEQLNNYKNIINELSDNRKDLELCYTEYKENINKLKNKYKIQINQLQNERTNLLKKEYTLGKEYLTINLGAFIHEISKELTIIDNERYPIINVICFADDTNINEILNNDEIDTKGKFEILSNNLIFSVLSTPHIKVKKTNNMIIPQKIQIFNISDYQYHNAYVDLYNICVDIDIHTLYYSLNPFFNYDIIKNIINNSIIDNKGKKLTNERNIWKL